MCTTPPFTNATASPSGAAPRMLGFIAKIAPEMLREARAQSGEITAAKLYEILIAQWLEHEHNPPGAPKGIPLARLKALVTAVACMLW